jgi:hypothetical protein
MTWPARQLRCPICVDVFDWTDDDLYAYSDGKYVPLQIPPAADPRRRQDLLKDAYRKCPNPSEDMARHYLPVEYGSYRDPLVIGLVGASGSGKTHLLAAMIAEIERGGLLPFDLTVGPVDAGRHQDYLRDNVQPLLATGTKLPRTVEGKADDFADALLISSPSGTWPVTFFDVSGEDLMSGRTTRFLAGTGGLIFVVDTDVLPGGAGSQPLADTGHLADRTFRAVLSRLRKPDERLLTIPAAIAITKADRLRFEPPVDWWLGRGGNGQVDPRQLAAECRAAYAFLYQRGALAWLQPFHDCQRCTLHFVSATGGEPRDGVLLRGFRPRRVLGPLLALLAMTGVLTGPDFGEVGT